MSNELIQAIGRLRRAQPRNPDTNMVCDALERHLTGPENCREEMSPKLNGTLDCPSERLEAAPSKASFDRNAYQREYMRKRRNSMRKLREKTT